MARESWYFVAQVIKRKAIKPPWVKSKHGGCLFDHKALPKLEIFKNVQRSEVLTSYIEVLSCLTTMTAVDNVACEEEDYIFVDVDMGHLPHLHKLAVLKLSGWNMFLVPAYVRGLDKLPYV